MITNHLNKLYTAGKIASLSCACYLLTSKTVLAASDFVHELAHDVEHIEHMESQAGLPQFDVTTFPSQLFWLFISFAILYLIFSFKTLPEISTVLERRKEAITNNLETAERMKNEADDVQYAYEQGLENVQNKARELVDASVTEGKSITDKRLDEFKKTADKEIKNLSIKIEQGKQDVFADINDISAEVVMLGVYKITGIEISKEEALRAVEALNEQKAKAA